ncbi:MAG: hypothetical protein KatS3mg031_0142 [Chitinophagales bacterium]|nr:MAG: hypothetical protein KatS3mg031_0142 [Chitinophagales bacterium]
MGIITANTQIFRVTLNTFALLLISTALCTAQSQSVSKKAQKLFAEGMEHLNWDRFEEAKKSFQEALQVAPDYQDALDNLAYTCLRLHQYEEAYEALKKLLQLNLSNKKQRLFSMARVCLATHRIEEGLQRLADYRTYSLSASEQAQANRLEASLLFVKDYLLRYPADAESQVTPLNAYINTSAREYFPTLTADGEKLFFTRHTYTANNVVNEDIYYSLWQGSDWGPSIPMPPNVNTTYNEAAATITPDGRKLFLTICEHPKNIGSCDIWVTHKVGDTWLDPQNLEDPVNTRSKETQPCLSGDGRSLYFCSNRKGGYGGLDLWVTHLQENGKWSEPENLGQTVNTPYDEQRPFIHPDNRTLYFSSEGHPGFGNADIFMSVKGSDGQWQKPVNIGLPINSFENEEGIFVSLDGTTGYFASDRFNSSETGKSNYDIYSFVLRRDLAPGAVTFVKGTVKDENGKGIAAKIDFIELNTKVKVNNTLSDEQNGEFLLTLETGKDYALNISKEGYLFHSENFSLKNLKAEEHFKLEVPLKKIKAGEKSILRNIFFAYNSAELQPQSEAELEILARFMQENPSINIEISGHTDSIGSEAFNKMLSEKRAKCVYDFLIAHQIPAPRLTYVGYGESQPIADNGTESGRALNRRTEFKIISQ